MDPDWQGLHIADWLQYIKGSRETFMTAIRNSHGEYNEIGLISLQ